MPVHTVPPVGVGAEGDRARESHVRRRHPNGSLVIAARRGRPGARAELVESYTPLIEGVARIYRNVPAVDRSELVQEGVVGVLRALERYDPEVGAPFWAYASWWVREAMQQLVAELSRPVVLSDRALRQLARARRAHSAFLSAHAREPSLRELAAASELPVAQLQRLTVADRRPRGLDEPCREGSDGGATFAEQLGDPRAEDAFEELAHDLDAPAIPELLMRVSERERAVIRDRFGLAGSERTLRELAQTLGVSAERVRQIEQAALEKMRAACAEGGLEAPRGNRRTARRRGAPMRRRASGPRMGEPRDGPASTVREPALE